MNTIVQPAEKLDHIIRMLEQITEYLRDSPMPQLLEQINTMTNFFKDFPDLLQTSTSVVTDEIIAEIKLISFKLERLQNNKNTERINRKYYKSFWK